MAEFNGPSLHDMGIDSSESEPPTSKPINTVETSTILQSTREYEGSPYIHEVSKYFQITQDSQVCLFGDGQGADTKQFLSIVQPENIKSINYDASEVGEANSTVLRDVGTKMQQGDASDWSSLKKAGLAPNSQDLVTLIHVLEVPDIKGQILQNLVNNLATVLKEQGHALIVQYKQLLSEEQAAQLGVQQIEPQDMAKRFESSGTNWPAAFQEWYGKPWRLGMRYSEISNIWSEEQLVDIFKDKFDIQVVKNPASSDEILLLTKKNDNQPGKLEYIVDGQTTSPAII